MTLRISAVVPTLDEEAVLPRTLDRLAPQVDELLIADGGSRDRTLELAHSRGARIVEGARGRGAQLAAGAAAAGGDLLLFVHADTLVPENLRAELERAHAAGAVGGAFTIRFDARGLAYRIGERVATWRSIVTGLAFGDQAQFAGREAYAAIGGHRAWPLFEDYDLARRLKQAGRVAIVRAPVVSSARRFERLGPARTVLFNWWLLVRFHAGASPEELATEYRRRLTRLGGAKLDQKSKTPPPERKRGF